MPRVIHFEIHASEPQRLITFYTALFGWQFSAWADQPYWLIKTGEKDTIGIDGGSARREGVLFVKVMLVEGIGFSPNLVAVGCVQAEQVSLAGLHVGAGDENPIVPQDGRRAIPGRTGQKRCPPPRARCGS